MIRAACLLCLLAILAHATPNPIPAGETVVAVDAAKPAVSQPTAVLPRPGSLDSLKTPLAPPGARLDSATARQYKVGNRIFTKEEEKQFFSAFSFQPRGKPESSAVIKLYRDAKGATVSFEKGMSEVAFAFDSVAFLSPKDYVPDSLIRTKTDGHLKSFLKEKMDQYAFVNFEKTMVQARDTAQKEGVAPAVPAFYVGRYIRKLGGRYVLGDNFQIRLSVGRSGTVNYLSFRNPTLTDSTTMVKVPTREMVQEYLDRWAKDRTRLGRRTYPYHPDNLRIRSLKPVKVFESYVLVQEKFRENPAKGGLYLTPKVTVLAEAVLVPSQKRLKMPAPKAPVLLHFHFPCTPAAGLCWPDGKQGMGDGPHPDIGPRPSPPPSGMAPPAQGSKSEGTPIKTSPATPPPPAPTKTAPKAP